MTKIKCPAKDCDVELEEDNLIDQSAHMRAKHPEIIEERLSISDRLAGWVND